MAIVGLACLDRRLSINTSSDLRYPELDEVLNVSNPHNTHNHLLTHSTISHIAKAFGLTSISHRSDTFASYRCPIEVDPEVIAMWDIIFFTYITPSELCTHKPQKFYPFSYICQCCSCIGVFESYPLYVSESIRSLNCEVCLRSLWMYQWNRPAMWDTHCCPRMPCS